VGSTFVQKIILEEKKGRTPTLNPFIALCAKPVKGLNKTKKDFSAKNDEQSREVDLRSQLSNPDVIKCIKSVHKIKRFISLETLEEYVKEKAIKKVYL
jgi:hypothetical protein